MAVFISLNACQTQPAKPVASYSDALVVVPGARGVKFGTRAGSDQVQYKVEASYPAAGVLAYISKDLAKKGWKPRQDDFLNPRVPSSHVRGWTKFENATKLPTTTVHQWMADWESPRKEIVWYCLRYSYPSGKSPDLHNLQVYAGYLPADLARAAQEEAERFLRSLDNTPSRKP